MTIFTFRKKQFFVSGNYFQAVLYLGVLAVLAGLLMARPMLVSTAQEMTEERKSEVAPRSLLETTKPATAVVENILKFTDSGQKNDPCSLTSSTVYPISILDQATVTLGNNLYSFGGASTFTTSNSYKFDGTTWTPIAPLPLPLGGSAAVTDGTFIYILGGYSGTSQTNVYRYDPVANSYTAMAPFTTGTWAAAAVYLNGKIYKFAGVAGATTTNVLEIYDIASNTWTLGNPYPIAISMVSVFVQGNYIYAAGGFSSLKTYRYDPLGNTWNDEAIADLPTTRWGAASSVTGYGVNNAWVLAGGYVPGDKIPANISDSVIQWDPVTNIWGDLSNLDGKRARMSGALLGGSFHIIGGRSPASPDFVGTQDNQKLLCPDNQPVIASGTTPLISESYTPANGSPDPGETVTVRLPLRNDGDTATTNLTATLQATGGVTNPISATQNYGVVFPQGLPVTKDFTFTVSPGVVCGSRITLTWLIADGATNYLNVTKTFVVGAPVVDFSENFDGVVAPALPAGWLTYNTGAVGPVLWTTNTTEPDTSPNSVFTNDPATAGDSVIESRVLSITSPNARISFKLKFLTESSFDGTVLEIKIGSGAYTDIIAAGGAFTANGYNSTISMFYTNPLAGRMAWTGNSGGYLPVSVNLPASANGQDVRFRWRMGSDNSVASTGVNLDSFTLANGSACLGQMFTINGQVTKNGNPLQGVSVQLSGSLSDSRVTDATGNYVFSNLPMSGNFTVTPSQFNHLFTPPSQTFNNISSNQTANFTAASCTAQVTPPGGSFPAGGGTFQFNIISPNGCAWHAFVNGQPWISIQGSPDGVGNGAITFSVEANSGTSRDGQILVDSLTGSPPQPFLISQDTARYSISGQITNTSGTVGGVTVSLGGASSGTTLTDSNGVYRFNNLPVADYTVTPFLAGAAFTPSGRNISLSANSTNQDFSQAVCTYSLSVPGASFSDLRATGSFNVTTPGACTRTAVSNVPWLIITGGTTGNGNGSVSYIVQRNYGAARSGTIAVNGQLYTVTQTAGVAPVGDEPISGNTACPVIFTVNSVEQTRWVIGFQAGSIGPITVNTGSNCQWTADVGETSSWITVTSGTSGTGVQTFTLSIMQNPGNQPRSGNVRVLGQLFTIIQTAPQLAGCSFLLNPLSAGYDLTGGGSSFNVTLPDTCNFSAWKSSDDIWVTTVNGFGRCVNLGGSCTFQVGYSLPPNSGALARTATVVAGDQAFTVNQSAGQVANCSYQISSTGQNFAASATSGNFTVTTGAGCSWTATPSAPSWITVTGGAGSGNGTVSFNLQANPDPMMRSGTVSVNGRTFTVTQASAQQTCNYTINPGFQSIAREGVAGTIQTTANAGCAWTAQSNAPWLRILSGAGGASGNGQVSFVALTNITSTGRIGTITVAGQLFSVTQEANPNGLPVAFDFDGDRKSDISIYRPSNGQWWINRGFLGQIVAAQFGNSTDKPMPADFTGDGRTDMAFYRPSTGFWYILRSENFTFYSFPFGLPSDVPVSGDFDADGKTDAGVFRPSNGTWYVQYSGGGTLIRQFGTATDKPVVADYDGDARSDLAIFRPSGANGAEWWYVKSLNDEVGVLQFGISTDKAVAGDYTGDGKADFGIWRPSSGVWYILRSEDFTFYSFPFGSNGDTPAPGDYDGDGKFDAAVFRPSSGTWFLNRSTVGVLIEGFGLSGDLPVPAAFVP